MNKPKIIYDVLTKLEPYSKNASKNPHPIECWKIALGVENDKYVDTLKLRVHLANSVYEIADTLEADNSDFNDRTWKNDLVSLLTSQNYDSNTFIAQLQKVYPYTRNMIALQIRTWDLIRGKSKILDESELQKIKQNTNELIECFINNEDIDDQARAFSIKQLRKILEVIDYYQIYGNEGIIEIIEESIGHTFINKSYQDFMKSENSDNWRKYLSDLSTIVATAGGMLAIATTLQKFIS